METGDSSLNASAINGFVFAHPFLVPIVQEMERPTMKRIMEVTWWSNAICCFIAFSVTAIEYLFSVDPEVEDNILYYLDERAPEVLLGKIAVLLISLCSTMYFTYFLARILSEWLSGPKDGRKVSVCVSGIALTFLAIAINQMGDSWLLFIYALGMIAFAVLRFVLPPVYYLDSRS
jgi:hypothetical protein